MIGIATTQDAALNSRRVAIEFKNRRFLFAGVPKVPTTAGTAITLGAALNIRLVESALPKCHGLIVDRSVRGGQNLVLQGAVDEESTTPLVSLSCRH